MFNINKKKYKRNDKRVSEKNKQDAVKAAFKMDSNSKRRGLFSINQWLSSLI